MNETQAPKNEKRTIIGLIILLAALVAGVILIFALLERTMPKYVEPGVEVAFALDGGSKTTGQLTLETSEEIEDTVVQDWMEQCDETEGFQWLSQRSEEGWDLYLWLPETEKTLDYDDLDLSASALGEQWTMTLSIPTEVTDTTGEDSQLIHIKGKSGKLPGKVQVYANSNLLEASSVCIASGTQFTWAY